MCSLDLLGFVTFAREDLARFHLVLLAFVPVLHHFQIPYRFAVADRQKSGAPTLNESVSAAVAGEPYLDLPNQQA